MTGDMATPRPRLPLSLSESHSSASVRFTNPPALGLNGGSKGGAPIVIIGQVNGVDGKTFTVVGAYRNAREIGKTNRYLGSLAERLVIEAVRSWLPLDIEVVKPELGPDLEIRSRWGRALVEIKASTTSEGLKNRIYEAFKREISFAIGIQWGKGAWIYESPQKRRKFTKRNLTRVLKKLGVI